MACPSDPEALRPRDFVEAISGDNTWQSFGIRIKWTDPVVPGNVALPVNEPVKLRVCVETKAGYNICPERLSAWCWTHIRAADNQCGIWREIKLQNNPRCTVRDDQGTTSLVFQSSVVPTADDLYRLTFNIKYDKLMIWANYFQVDNLVDVQTRPSVGTQYDIKHDPTAWTTAIQNMLPQAFSYYASYFQSLFTDKGDQSASKRKRTDTDEVEMLVRL